MSTKLPYTKLFREFEQKIRQWPIYKSVDSIYWRIIIYFGSGIVMLGILITTLFLFPQSIANVIFTAVVAVVYLLSIQVVHNRNRKDLLKTYGKLYSFSDDDKQSVGAVLAKIKFEKLRIMLGDLIDDKTYVKFMIKCGKKSAKETKKTFRVQEYGVVLVVLIFIDKYADLLFELLSQNLRHRQIFLLTVAIILTTIYLYIFYHQSKDLILSFRNREHKAHIELVSMLQGSRNQEYLKQGLIK